MSYGSRKYLDRPPSVFGFQYDRLGVFVCGLSAFVCMLTQCSCHLLHRHKLRNAGNKFVAAIGGSFAGVVGAQPTSRG